MGVGGGGGGWYMYMGCVQLGGACGRVCKGFLSRNGIGAFWGTDCYGLVIMDS